MSREITGHSGDLAVSVAEAHGVHTMFTLSGAHVVPMYDGAVKAEPPMRLLDVRHELAAETDPIHPARSYGELAPQLADDAVVIGDGGDFVSFAGKFVEPQRPGGWLDPGPALDRAFESGVPCLLNVITDVIAAYPRSTFGV